VGATPSASTGGLKGSADLTFSGAVAGKTSELSKSLECVDLTAAATLKTYPLNVYVKLNEKAYQVTVLVGSFTNPPSPGGYAFGGDKPAATLNISEVDHSEDLWTTGSKGSGSFKLNADGRGGSFDAKGATSLANGSSPTVDVTGTFAC
jgi:hypothetical protein